MKRALFGLSLFSLAALAGPAVASADGGAWLSTPAAGSVNVPTTADDASQSALVVAMGGDPTLAPLPSQLPGLAADEAVAAVESASAE